MRQGDQGVSDSTGPGRMLRAGLPLVGATLLGACGGVGVGTPPALPPHGPTLVEGPAGFVRAVSPFEVLNAEGEPYEHPFLGGFTTPRPQFVDIDADGTLDLFVHERPNELMFLENVGSPGEPRYEWRTDRWKGLDVGEWTRFVDVDGDGRIDLLAEELYSYIRVYRNEGTPEEPEMVLVPDSLRDSHGRPIFADRQNIPAFQDIDGNGRLDMFLGRIEGTVSRYQALPRQGDQELPRFRLVADRFEGIEIIGTLVQPTMHGANSMFFADADGNGLEDLYWGDFFEAGLLLIENQGSPSTPNLRTAPRPVYSGTEPIATSGFNAPVLADLFDRGRPDLFLGVLGGAYNPVATAADNFHHYWNDGEGNFQLVTTRFLHGIDVGEESIPTLGDVNGNGLMDLLVGNKTDPGAGNTARLYWFENIGSATDPRYQLRDTLDLVPSYHYAPALADLWDDELPGLVLGTFTDGLRFYRNVGGVDGPAFELQEEMSTQLSRGSHGVPGLADLTGNGLMDLAVGRSNGELSFYRNVGSAAEPSFELVTDQWLEIRVGRRARPAFVDLTENGLPDLVVGREEPGAVVFRNVGTPTEPRFQEDPSLELPLHAYATAAFADLNGNGRKELIAGSGSGGLIYFERR